MFLVKNNNPALHRIGLGEPEDFIDLMPGVNNVDEEKWERASKNPMVKWRLKCREYELVKNVTADVVAETVVPALLEEFGKSKSKTIKKAVAVQMDRLELTDAEKKSAAKIS